MAIINMTTMRYINLLDKVSHVKTSKCFIHNNTIFFAVNARQISRAIGPSAENVKRISVQLGKRVKVIKEAKGVADAKRFIEDIVAPIRLKSLEIKDGIMVLTAGNTQNKAILMGRNKGRMEELKTVVKDEFRVEMKIV